MLFESVTNIEELMGLLKVRNLKQAYFPAELVKIGKLTYPDYFNKGAADRLELRAEDQEDSQPAERLALLSAGQEEEEFRGVPHHRLLKAGALDPAGRPEGSKYSTVHSFEQIEIAELAKGRQMKISELAGLTNILKIQKVLYQSFMPLYTDIRSLSVRVAAGVRYSREHLQPDR